MKQPEMKQQRGSVIIVTLWTITLLTILITVIAAQIRLSAQVAYFHQTELQDWAAISSAMNQAEIELMMERMREPLKRFEDLSELQGLGTNPVYRFNGQKITLNYPQAENVTVRIYNHAGKINLREISRQRLRALLENLIGKETENVQEQLDQLLAAWGDWQDLNDRASVDGAEAEYYEALEKPFTPRNGPMETVEELLLIKGFAEVFAGIDLDAAFTLYGENEFVNLNLATVEAMRLLPGLDEELVREILEYRQENEFRGNGDVAQIVPAENMAILRPWLESRNSSSYYTIMVYKDEPEDVEDSSFSDFYNEAQDLSTDEVTAQVEAQVKALQENQRRTTAYAEIVDLSGGVKRPKIMKANPYQPLPVDPLVLLKETVL